MPPRQFSRALGFQRQDSGEEVQAGRVDTPARFDDERHEVRLVAVRLRLLAVVRIKVHVYRIHLHVLEYSSTSTRTYSSTHVRTRVQYWSPPKLRPSPWRHFID